MITLWKTRNSFPVRKVEAKVGLMTDMGPIVRITAKTIFVQRPDGGILPMRDRLPAVA